MSDHDFESAPDLSREFDEADSIEIPDIAYDFDAASWEPTEEPDLPRPSEKHLTLDYTPGGYLEYDVHSELDERARREIRYKQQSLESDNEFTSLGNEWDEVAKREFEEWQRQDLADYVPEEEEPDSDDWNGQLGQRHDRDHGFEQER